MPLTSLRLLLGFSVLSFSLVACGPQVRPDDDDDSSGDDDDDVPAEFSMWSPDFIDDSEISHSYDCEQALPVEFSCDGSNPQIAWEGAPEGTVAFAMVFDDPTAGNFPHWAIYNIPGTASGLDAGISGNGVTNVPPGGAIELANGFGWQGYLGSCPGGVNHYRWRLWALSEELPSGLSSYSAVEAAAGEASLDSVSMCHVFDGAATGMGR